MAIRTLAAFLRGGEVWDARQAYLAAVGEWHSRFAVTGPPIDLEDLVRFCDCYYLPHEEGPEAEALYALVRSLLARPPAEWGDDGVEFRSRAARLRDVCVRLTELRDRPLFHALSRRVWELREELDLLERYVAARSAPGGERDAVPIGLPPAGHVSRRAGGPTPAPAGAASRRHVHRPGARAAAGR